MTSSLAVAHNDFKKVLMGQVSKRLVIWSTSRMLRWEKLKEYKKERIPLQSEHQKKRERNHFVTKNLHICISLRDIYINVPSSDLTEECFSFQLVRLSHFNTKLTYCDSYLTRWTFSVKPTLLTKLLLWAYWVIVQIFLAVDQSEPLQLMFMKMTCVI